MLDRLKKLLAGPAADAPADRAGASAPAGSGASAAVEGRSPISPEDHRLQVAACALLLELAHVDDEFSDEERRHLEDTLARHFDLSPAETAELLAVADETRREAIDLHQFTSFVTEQYDEGQRMVLAEVMWRVVYADGVLTDHEDALMRKIARLLDLRPGYLAAARRRAVAGGGEGEGGGGGSDGGSSRQR